MDDLTKIIEEALKSQEPINVDVERFLTDGIAYSESALATQFTDGQKLRQGFKLDLITKIVTASKSRTLQPKDVLIIARDYNFEMWKEYEENTGELDATLKSFLSLEVAEGLKDSGNFDSAGLHEKLLVSTEIMYANKKQKNGA